MRKYDIVDRILWSLIVIGLTMTAVNFFAARGPSSEVISSSIQEIKPAPPPARHFGQPILDDRPQIKLSEARTNVRKFVEEIDADAQARGLEALSEEDKNEMVEALLRNMKAQGSYNFVDQ